MTRGTADSDPAQAGFAVRELVTCKNHQVSSLARNNPAHNEGKSQMAGKNGLGTGTGLLSPSLAVRIISLRVPRVRGTGPPKEKQSPKAQEHQKSEFLDTVNLTALVKREGGA